MHNERPNPNVWGNILTFVQIAMGIWQIIGTKKRGLEIEKDIAGRVLPDAVVSRATADGENLCITDPVDVAIAADELISRGLITDPDIISKMDCLRQIEDPSHDSGFEPPYSPAVFLRDLEP